MRSSPKKIKMYMGIPTTGSVVDDQAYTLRELERRYGHLIEFVYPKTCVRRIFHDFARNAIVEEFLESDCDVLWFLDSDITPPRHVLDLIALHWEKWEAAGAPYPVFMTPTNMDRPQVIFTVFKGKSDKGLTPTNIPQEGTEMVDGIATGCIFLKREVFGKLEKPYFEFKYDSESRQIAEGEDLGFCLKLSEKGVQFFVDYSMVCKHQKKVCLLEVNNYCLDFAKRSVEGYDKRIRGQIESLKAHLESRAAKSADSKPKSGLIIPSLA